MNETNDRRLNDVSEMLPLEFYRRDSDGVYQICLRLREIQQLFESLDPSPFREKDLDPKAEQYILESVGELPQKARFKLLFHVTEKQQDLDVPALEQAIHHFFDYRVAMVRRELREVFRLGRRTLLVGLVFLGSCLVARQLLASLLPEIGRHILSEGLLIVGWVAMWRPIEILLYEWIPVMRKCQQYQRLAAAPIKLEHTRASQA